MTPLPGVLSAAAAPMPPRPARPLPPRAVWALALIILSGCATRPPVAVGDRASLWQARSARLGALTQWALTGRIAMQIERDGWTASLQWRQREGEYVLRVSAPLGRGTVELSGARGGVTLQTADNRLLHAEDPETLLQQTLGWRLPVSGLYYWIRGLPDPDAKPDALQLDDRGRLNDLRQSGWEIRYERYDSRGGLDLPEKITLENDRVKVRLVISDWGLSS